VQTLEVEAFRPKRYVARDTHGCVSGTNDCLNSCERTLKGRRGPEGNQSSADSLAELNPDVGQIRRVAGGAALHLKRFRFLSDHV
jgi:hypothetical protein